MVQQQPFIGITARRSPLAEMFPRDAALLGGHTAELHLSAFGEQVAAAGGIPCPISWHAEPDALLDRLDGLVLSGGEDVDPRRSGAPGARDVDLRRDAFELALLDAALARGLPVLGICRGMQLANVALGGSIRIVGAHHDRRDLPFATRAHRVECDPATAVGAGYGRLAHVNSVHRQAVDRLATSLTAAAWSPDGLVEAAVDRAGSILCVQWHPEFHELGDPAFNWLVVQARRRRCTPSAA